MIQLQMLAGSKICYSYWWNNYLLVVILKFIHLQVQEHFYSNCAGHNAAGSNTVDYLVVAGGGGGGSGDNGGGGWSWWL